MDHVFEKYKSLPLRPPVQSQAATEIIKQAGGGGVRTTCTSHADLNAHGRIVLISDRGTRRSFTPQLHKEV
jgi:hypothetical protein